MSPITYKSAGVDVDAGNALVDRIKKMTPFIGGFAGMLPMPKGYKQPMIVGCTDGVGTKLKVAFLTNTHDTVGIDLVAMNVNDLLCCGAKPMFFLDYFGCGKLDVGVAEKVISGIVEGCRQAQCALLGGETAEMPGFYEKGEYDLAGFAVGIVEKSKVIDGKSVRAGDILLGLPSSGVHSNGYSLVRKLFSEYELRRRAKEFLAPTKIYVSEILPLLKAGAPRPKAMAHITGGGFIDNIPRMYSKKLRAVIRSNSWPVPALFQEMQQRAKTSDEEMYRTFNMGIGLVLIVSPKDEARVRKQLKISYRIGVMENGPGGIRFA